MDKRNVYVLMNGINLNHDGERFRFKATTDKDEADAIIAGLRYQNEKPQEILEEEYGNGWVNLMASGDFVYVVWLNELSRIYAGNEIMAVADNEDDIKREFHDQWVHQNERWGFSDYSEDYQEEVGGDREEPKIDFSKSDGFSCFRHAEDCEQILGVIKLKVNSGNWEEEDA